METAAQECDSVYVILFWGGVRSQIQFAIHEFGYYKTTGMDLVTIVSGALFGVTSYFRRGDGPYTGC